MKIPTSIQIFIIVAGISITISSYLYLSSAKVKSQHSSNNVASTYSISREEPIVSGGNTKNIEDFGAVGDGKTDNSTVIQSIINILSRSGGGTINVPTGTFICGNVVTYGNISFQGIGNKSVIKQITGSNYCISINPGKGGSSDPHDNATEISFANINFISTVVQDGFSEHCYLLNLNAVSNVIIDKCIFQGFRGDGIYLGSSNIPGIERHNNDIKINSCLFDGLCNNNRNGISVIDGRNITIDNCIFSNCTQENMPGAIDIEPDKNLFSVVKNIRISNCKFDNNNGTANISIYLPIGQNRLTTPISSISITNCEINDSHSKFGIFICQRDFQDNSPKDDIIIDDCKIISKNPPIRICGITGAKIHNCIIQGEADLQIGGKEFNETNSNITIDGNTFINTKLNAFNKLQLIFQRDNNFITK
jgi:hypothetical protein